MLDGTSCSATETTALAPGSSSPTMPAPASCARVGLTAATPRLTASTATITAPASPKRAPAPSSGGIVSTRIRIARYVDPQTM